MDGHSKKSCSNPGKGPLQPFFRNKKPQVPYLQTLVFLPHLSSSPDLRIISIVRPSRASPMTGFHPAQSLPRIQWRYRPGFSPGFLFSCGAVTASTGTQTEYLLVKTVYKNTQQKSIVKMSQGGPGKAAYMIACCINMFICLRDRHYMIIETQDVQIWSICTNSYAIRC